MSDEKAKKSRDNGKGESSAAANSMLGMGVVPTPATEQVPKEVTGMSEEASDAAILDEIIAEEKAKPKEKKSAVNADHEAADQKRAEERAAASKRHRIHLSDIKNLAPVKRKTLAKWTLSMLCLGLIYLIIGCVYLHGAGNTERSTWYDEDRGGGSYSADVQHAQEIADANGATKVNVGTYVEKVDKVSIKESTYQLTAVVWFRWDGKPDLDMMNNVTFYKGTINKQTLLREETQGDTNYQLVRYTVTVNKVYYTSRFPLESHQLRMYLESSYPARDVIFVDDGQSSVNGSLSVAGYDLKDADWGITAHQYDSLEGDPTRIEPPITSEYITALTIERNGLGLYLKCFLAMFGTSLWVLIMLYICGNHRVDPLGMIPAALFGTVSNIMVGASLLPDALDLGLLELVNIWGILTILAVALSVIQINHIRSEFGRKDESFARFFGRAMFFVVAGLAVAGNIALPLSAVL